MVTPYFAERKITADQFAGDRCRVCGARITLWQSLSQGRTCQQLSCKMVWLAELQSSIATKKRYDRELRVKLAQEERDRLVTAGELPMTHRRFQCPYQQIHDL